MVSAVLLGQVCSLLLATCSLASSQLNKLEFAYPALQNTLVYLVLSLHLLRKRTSAEKTTSSHFWTYAVLAVFDFEANYAIVWAFSMTSMTSAQILAGCTLPFVVGLRAGFLGARYSAKQQLAVVVGVVGLGLIIYSDFRRSGLQQTRALKGDALALAAALLYASCNCLEEKVLRDSCSDSRRMLGMLGLFGSLLGLVQGAATLELSSFSDRVLEGFDFYNVSAYLALYVVALGSFYHVLALFLAKFDAAIFNLSILSAGVYAATFEGIVAVTFVLKNDWLYAGGFLALLLACAYYHLGLRSANH